MSQQKAYFEGRARLHLKQEPGAKTSQASHTDIRLETSSNVNKQVYYDGQGNMRQPALKPLTQTFIQGLIANVKYGHDRGWWNESEHMRYIIDELGRSFATPTEKPEDSTLQDY